MNSNFLKNIKNIKSLSFEELQKLSNDIRKFLIESISNTGGHLGSNLGVVELTIGIHRAFDLEKDSLIFDIGHQAYTHKLLTNRTDFSKLRKKNGLSGYPQPNESKYDVFQNSHASTGISWGLGVSTNNPDWVIVVVGDGSLTGGVAWEALNQVAIERNKKLIIVVNDNNRSYSKTTGGFALNMQNIKNNRFYEDILDKLENAMVDRKKNAILRGLKRVKKSVKAFVSPQILFEDLGIKYIGPINGHNIEDIENAIKQAKRIEKPTIIHAITKKGHGYKPAVANESDKLHVVSKFDIKTGNELKDNKKTWTDIFETEIEKIATKDKNVYGITAAMLEPVGLKKFHDKYQDRVIDVGIAEEHALAFAAGLSHRGHKPVVALYSTFANRAYDQMLMDIGLNNKNVTLVLDRAGITGDDGPSHNGQWDIALLKTIPNIKIYSPKDVQTLKTVVNSVILREKGLKVIRYPKGKIPLRVNTHKDYDEFSTLNITNSKSAIVTDGAFSEIALKVAKKLKINCIYLKRLWPITDNLLKHLKKYKKVFTIEDGIINGGVGESLKTKLENSKVYNFGVPNDFLSVGTREEILKNLKLDYDGLLDRIMKNE